MYILRTHPITDRERLSRNYFLRLVGDSVTRWAFVDRALFGLFRASLGLDRKSAGIVYYRLTTISSKLNLADAGIRLIATSDTLEKWSSYKKTLDKDLIPV